MNALHPSLPSFVQLARRHQRHSLHHPHHLWPDRRPLRRAQYRNPVHAAPRRARVCHAGRDKYSRMLSVSDTVRYRVRGIHQPDAELLSYVLERCGGVWVSS